MGDPPSSPLLRAKQVFLAVRELPLPQRDDEVERLCAGDARLRGMVEGLLAGDQAPLPFESLADDIVAARDAMAPTAIGQPGPAVDDPDSQLGSRIGRYRVLEKIGEGGFGMVYMAEQDEPVRRRVALKILKLGMDTRQIVARFEAERQALAIMDHPGIAKVHDAGATPTGRPFFVMELCSGTSITDYCDRRQLAIPERLSLFIQVCEAVQHAHQKGLIHRDIKPSNILVSDADGKPLAKVIDFGIAKATQARLTEKTFFTENRQLIGTPEYMSPEQAEGSLDIDTRTDVYSLGVLLYELLTGSTPFTSRELRSAAFAEIQRIIREVEPPRPSTRLTQDTQTIASIAATRRIEPRRLGALIRGELDWIAMKALEKNRARRYTSAADFAADIQRYLADQPVTARPATRRYRLGKFVRRNKALVTGSLLALASLTGGLVFSTVMYFRADHARRLADAERRFALSESAKAKAVNGFLVEDVLAAPNPWEGAGRSVTVADVLGKAAGRVEKRFAQTPEVEAAIRSTLGESYRALGLFSDAQPQYDRALTIRKELANGSEAELADSLRMRAANLQALGELKDADAACRDALDRNRRLFGDESLPVAITLETLCDIQVGQSLYADAQTSIRKALDIYKAHPDGQDVAIARATNTLGSAFFFAGDYTQAIEVKRRALDAFKAALGERSPYVAQVYNDLGVACSELERYKDAERYFRRALPILTELLGPEHAVVFRCQRSLATALSFSGDDDRAEPMLRDTVAACERVFGPAQADTLATINCLATMLMRAKRLEEAEPLFRSLYDRSAQSFGERHAETLKYASNLAWCEAKLGNSAVAEEYFRKAVEGFDATLGRTHPDSIAALDGLAQFLDAQQRWAEAADCDQRIVDARAAAGLPEDMDTARFLNRVGTNRLHAKQYAAAKEPLTRSLEICKKNLPAVDWRMAIAHGRLGECLSFLGQNPEAEAQLQAGIDMSRTDPEAPPGSLTSAMNRMIAHYERSGQPERAAKLKAELPEPAKK